jgi:hypothetical protein
MDLKVRHKQLPPHATSQGNASFWQGIDYTHSDKSMLTGGTDC